MLDEWTFFSGADGISGIDIFPVNDPAPLYGTGSLQIRELFTPNLSTAAGIYTVEHGLFSGRLQTIFAHRSGMGFREHGLFFLCSEEDPYNPMATGYMVSLKDGMSVFHLAKFSEGLHGPITILEEYMSPLFDNTFHTIMLDVTWKSGIFLPVFGGVPITVKYALDTDNPSNLISLGTYTDTDAPLSTTLSEGFFSLSTMAIEPLYAQFDTTRIYKQLAEG